MRRLLALAGAALGGALALAVVLALTGGSDGTAPTTFTAADGGYSIAAPRGWERVADGPAATVLRRADERGVLVIRRRAAVAGDLEEIAAGLERTLRRRLPDFRPAGSRVATVRGQQRLVYTFVRPRADKVQSIVVAPAGDHAYTLDLVADGDAPDVARELGRMVTSFTLES